MSCEVCYGHPGCPICSPAPHLITCPVCYGKGFTYYNENGDEITEDEYNTLPKSKRDKEACEECDGTGEIEYDYEPDYDNYDD